MIGCSVGVDDVENAFARDDKAVAEALAFRGMFTWLEFWVLAFVVASEVADDVRVSRLGENEGRGVMGFEFLPKRCKMRQG